MLRWTPAQGGACSKPIHEEIAAPQSPPWAREAAVSQGLGHEFREHPGDGAGADGARRLARPAVAGKARRHHVERVLGLSAEAFGMRQRFENLHELEHGAGPAVAYEQRRRRRAAAPQVDVVEVQPVDAGGELGEAVERRLRRPPVVGVQPVRGQRLHVVEVRAIGPAAVFGRFVPRESGDAGADVVERAVGNGNGERFGHLFPRVS